MDNEPHPWPLASEDVRRAVDDAAVYSRERGKAAVNEAVRKYAGIPQPDYQQLDFTTPADLAGKPIPEQVWVVPEWLPAATVALLYGAGGQGKTLLLQMLMTCVATGTPWLGLDVMQGPAVGLFSEDDEPEMHRRQDRINRALGVDFADLGDMWWTVPVGTDNTLLRFDPDGTPRQTDRFMDFAAKAKARQPVLIVLDVVADLFAGSENDRSQVAQFLKTTLGSLARDTGAVVVVAAHPSKSSISSGDLDSGSTGWNGGVRTRLTLAPPEADDGAQVDEDARVLRKAKANRSRRGDEIELHYRNGVFLPKHDIGHGVVAAIDKQNAERVFLELLAKLVPQGRHASDSRNSTNYAPRLFGFSPDRQGLKRRDFEIAMNGLFARGVIRVEPYGKRSDKTKHIVRVVAGEGAAKGGEGGGEG